jgi:CBS domain-containing protein
MADPPRQQPSVQPPHGPATVAEVMQPPLTTADANDHIAAAAYLMKHAGASALLVLDARTGKPAGIITERDVAHAVADGKDVNSVRIHDLMTARPTVISAATNVREAAEIMTTGHFRHLPVLGEDGVAGMVDISDVCRALLDPSFSRVPGDATAPPA